MTFLNHRDYRFRVKNFVWNIKVENLPGEIFVYGPNLIFGRNGFKFITLAPETGAVLDTSHPYVASEEREDVYSGFKILVDKQKYSEVALRTIPRQYRGDTETHYLIVKTLSNKEFTILFNRWQFESIGQITWYKDGKYIITYNGEAGSMDHKIPYKLFIGLLDLEKIIKKR